MATFWQRFSYWQNRYMAARLGKDWATSGATVTTDGFAEQTAFCSMIYGAAKALFGCEPPSGGKTKKDHCALIGNSSDGPAKEGNAYVAKYYGSSQSQMRSLQSQFSKNNNVYKKL